MKLFLFLFLQILYSEAFWITVVGIAAFVIALAAFLKAVSEINKTVFLPLKNRINNELLKPLELVAAELTEIKTNVTEIRRTTKTEFREMKQIVEAQAFNLEFLRFKYQLNLQRDQKAFFIADERGRIEFANIVFCDLLGLDSANINNKFFYELPCKEKHEIRNLWLDAIQMQSIHNARHIFCLKNSDVLIEIEAHPFIYAGEVKKFFGYITKHEIN